MTIGQFIRHIMSIVFVNLHILLFAMPRVFFSYTSALELWSELIVSALAKRFEGDCGWDTHDWVENPIPGGAQLYEALQKQVDASEIFVALIHDDYFADDKVAAWEFDTWSKDWGDRKIVIPIILSDKGRSGWNEMCQKHADFGKGIDIENSTYLDLSHHVKGEPGKDTSGKYRLSDPVSNQLKQIVTYVQGHHALVKEARQSNTQKPARPKDEGQVLLVLGGLTTPVAEEFEGYDALIDGLRDTLAPLKIEVEDIGDQWVLPELLSEDKQEILRRVAGKKKHVLMMSDDPSLQVAFGGSVDARKLSTIEERLCVLLSAEADPETAPIAGERFVWFRDCEVPEISPEFPCRSIEGPEPGQAIQNILGSGPQLQARFEMAQNLFDPLTRWYPREARRRLKSEDGKKVLARTGSQIIDTPEALAKTLKRYPSDTPLVLTILDKDAPPTALNNIDALREHVMARFDAFEDEIRNADCGEDRQVFGVLVQFFNETDLFETGIVQGSTFDWLVLPVRREDGDENKPFFDPAYLKTVRTQFRNFRNSVAVQSNGQ